MTHLLNAEARNAETRASVFNLLEQKKFRVSLPLLTFSCWRRIGLVVNWPRR
jgi:hypothetical protein